VTIVLIEKSRIREQDLSGADKKASPSNFSNSGYGIDREPILQDFQAIQQQPPSLARKGPLNTDSEASWACS
jgi:hypothetical protein